LEKAGGLFKNEGLVEKGQAKRNAAGADVGGDSYGSSGNTDTYGSSGNTGSSNNDY